MAERVKVTLRLSNESHRGWERAALNNGVTFTALAEAIGLFVDEHPERTDAQWNDIIDRARAIDLERRNRR